MPLNSSQSANTEFSLQDNPKLFSIVGTVLLIIGVEVLFFIAQLAGVYFFAPIVYDQQILTVAQRFLIGSANGTVVSYSMIFTMIVMLFAIYIIVKWRIKKVVKLAEKGDKSKISDQSISANIRIKVKDFKVSDYLALKPFSFKIGLAVLILWVVFVIGSQLFSYILERNPTEFVDELYFTAEPKWLLILVMVVIAPIYEEFIFRGVLWQAVKDVVSNDNGAIVATVITSIIFSVTHLQYEIFEMVMVLILALILGYARAKSGSLWLPIIIHMVNNGFAMWLYLLAT